VRSPNQKKEMREACRAVNCLTALIGKHPVRLKKGRKWEKRTSTKRNLRGGIIEATGIEFTPDDRGEREPQDSLSPLGGA